MIEQDTVRLLRECDAGVQMGIASIDEVLDQVKSEEFRGLLHQCKEDHGKLDHELEGLLDKYHDEGKSPSPIAQSMSWMKSNVMMSMTPSDRTIADLMTDGCNTGVKSLHKYLNEYANANEKAKDITKRLINLEEKLAVDIRSFL